MKHASNYLFFLLFFAFNFPLSAQDTTGLYWIRKCNIESIKEYRISYDSSNRSYDTSLYSIKKFNKKHYAVSETYYDKNSRLEVTYGLKFDTLTVQMKATEYPSGKIIKYEMYEYDKKGHHLKTFTYYSKKRVTLSDNKYNSEGRLTSQNNYSPAGKKKDRVYAYYDHLGRKYLEKRYDYSMDKTYEEKQRLPETFRHTGYKAETPKKAFEIIVDRNNDTIKAVQYFYNADTPRFVIQTTDYLSHPNNQLKPYKGQGKQTGRKEYYHFDNGLYSRTDEFKDGEKIRSSVYEYTYYK